MSHHPWVRLVAATFTLCHCIFSRCVPSCPIPCHCKSSHPVPYQPIPSHSIPFYTPHDAVLSRPIRCHRIYHIPSRPTPFCPGPSHPLPRPPDPLKLRPGQLPAFSLSGMANNAVLLNDLQFAHHAHEPPKRCCVSPDPLCLHPNFFGQGVTSTSRRARQLYSNSLPRICPLCIDWGKSMRLLARRLSEPTGSSSAAGQTKRRIWAILVTSYQLRTRALHHVFTGIGS